MCYFPPSGEGKFYSKLEVVRYLNNSNPKSEEKEKGIDQHNENVVVEKAEPKGLPPGWTKEIKVTKKAHKIRRDSYYTDPASGYVFRSMKDVLRYLETGEVGKQAFKPKDKGNNDVELEDDKACSPAAAKKQKLAVNGTRSPTISEKSSKPFEVAKDEQVLSSANTGESLPVSEHNVVGAQSNSSEVPEGKGSNQTVGKSDPATSVIATAVDILPNEPPVESRVMKDEIRSTPQKCKKKKNLNLPRRASKRLAGLPLDPTPELKTTNRARQAPVKQSDDIVVSTGGGSSHTELPKSTKCSFESNKSKHPIVHTAAPSEHVEKVESVKRGDEKPEHAVVSSIGNLVETENEDSKKCEHAVLSAGRNLAIGEEHPGMIITDNNADEKPGLPIDLPLGELWQDPCIAFAIKILTGISFDNSGSVQVSSGSNNSEFGSSTALEDHARKEEDHRKQGCTVHQPLVNIVTSEERPRGIDIGDKSDEKPGSPLSFADAWADPCIEFAIKTLTDAIPLDYDMVIQDCLPQKASSSQSQESSGLTLQNVGEPGQTEFFYRQFGISEKPSYNQGALMEPALPHAKNVNLGYSGGAIHHQLSEDRSKEYKR
ncbi:methyl-CpG-binding domain-containing protein 13 isoform X2 [Hevea brasiliensis]|uniref:methyl-CpG-binding domain-containing protein 13 isoform X2 n=1 Tax=Hevea brasiliensis TaxID=3981 RepID=UPI0025E70FFB|nr:methyl-CpG-binding domain-containing protein 13 isoform X2 [Hevea brasiliensis]